MRDIQVGYIFGVLGQNNTSIRIENSLSVSTLIVYFIRIQQRNYIIDIRNLKKASYISIQAMGTLINSILKVVPIPISELFT